MAWAEGQWAGGQVSIDGIRNSHSGRNGTKEVGEAEAVVVGKSEKVVFAKAWTGSIMVADSVDELVCDGSVLREESRDGASREDVGERKRRSSRELGPLGGRYGDASRS